MQKKYVFLRGAAAVLGGFILGGTTLTGGISPMLPALAGALDVTGGMFAFIGGMLYHLLSGTLSGALGQITALLGILIVKVIVYEFAGKECKAAGSAFIVAGASAICGIIVALSEARGGIGIMTAVSGAVLSGSLAYFLVTAVSSFKREGRIILTGITGGSAAGVFVALISALSGIDLLFFNFGRIAGTAALLIAVRRYKSSGGALISALIMCGLALASPELARPAVLMGASAVITGAFRSRSAFFMLAAFLASNMAGLSLIGITPANARFVADLIAGSALFVLIPERALNSLLGNASLGSSSEYSEVIASRLDFEARTISSVRKNISDLGKALINRRAKDGGLSVRVSDKVCGKCRGRLLCWETKFDDTFNCFEEMARIAEKTGVLSMDGIPGALSSCTYKDELQREFTAAAEALRLERHAENRIRDMQEILNEQMTASEKILSEISGELTDGRVRNHEAEKTIKSVLLDSGAKNPRVQICMGENGTYYGDIYFSGDSGCDEKALSLELSGLLDRNIEAAEISSAGEITKISFREIPALKLETGSAQSSCEPDGVSGDSHGIFRDHNGNVCVLISDGMGSGRLAAVDSCMTVAYLSKFLKAGTGLDGALHLVNSALMSKSQDESFATVDLVRIDPRSGEAELVKLGASSTFLLSGGKLSSLGTRSFPVGILGGVNPEKKSFMMKSGDVLVMTTDGIEEDKYPAVTEILKNAAQLSAKEISDGILKAAASSSNEKPTDDVTVVTVKVHKTTA